MQNDDIVPGLIKAIDELSRDENKRKEYSHASALMAWKHDVGEYLELFSKFIKIWLE